MLAFAHLCKGAVSCLLTHPIVYMGEKSSVGIPVNIFILWGGPACWTALHTVQWYHLPSLSLCAKIIFLGWSRMLAVAYPAAPSDTKLGRSSRVATAPNVEGAHPEA